MQFETVTQSQQAPAVQNASEPEAHAPSQAETQPPQEESQLKEVNGEAALAKALFERGTKLPDSPHPKAAVNETTSCPGVYYPDQLALTYHERTWGTR